MMARSNMAETDIEVLMNARTVLVEMRQNWIKTIAAGYKQGETEAAIKGLIEIQQAIDVVDDAAQEQELEEELEELSED
ncbi:MULTISPECIES: hypothetical protein [unclassified Bradyrhizobium]|uniref:hypothetical protein n=2 Tax=unclassified Bradyrhizobium TaxID=2631580 RepID=UPI00291631AF|nr:MULTISPECIES: hypothetical protein [unclassified Bradyrhizobium]